MTTISKRFPKPPFVELVNAPTGGRIYRLARPLAYYTDVLKGEDGKGTWIHIPAGYESDGASVPRLFWRFFPPSGQYTGAAIVHDALCDREFPCTSQQAADIFDEAMIDLGIPWRTRWPMVKAVRWFGPRFGRAA
jgi:hypothetical protein